jgi:hypothetical protein
MLTLLLMLVQLVYLHVCSVLLSYLVVVVLGVIIFRVWGGCVLMCVRLDGWVLWMFVLDVSLRVGIVLVVLISVQLV